MSVAINFVGMEKLMTIPGIGVNLARLILTVREHHGNIMLDTLISLTRGKISNRAIDSIDISLNEDFGVEAEGYVDSLAFKYSRVRFASPS